MPFPNNTLQSPECSAGAVLTCRACAVLHPVHACDHPQVIIHRDLKLQNFILKPVGGTQEAGGRKLPVAKLTDFGLHVVRTKGACSGGFSLQRHLPLVHCDQASIRQWG